LDVNAGISGIAMVRVKLANSNLDRFARLNHREIEGGSVGYYET
jgi:hypothetical protein